MDDRSKLIAMRALVGLQGAGVVAAQSRLAAAEAALAQAAAKTREQDDLRGAALDRWAEALGKACPDPHFVTLAAGWLVEQERRLDAARLDEAIARGNRDDAARACAEKMAQRDVTTDLGSRLARRTARARAERGAHSAGERHLSRWQA